MDPYDAGAIHVCQKLGWEFTKAHLDLYDSLAKAELLREMPPLERIDSDTDNEDWAIQGDWGTLYLGRPIVLPQGAGYLCGWPPRRPLSSRSKR